jgi:DedD protein
MRGVFDERESQQAEAGHDTELTLGSMTLLLILFGLVLLCGLCFGLGYAMGHRGTPDSAEVLPATSGTHALTPSEGAQPKPSAVPQASVPQPAGTTDQQEPADSSAADVDATNPGAPAADGSSNGQPQVKSAFANPAIAAQSAQPASAAVGPALGSSEVPAGELMVQIAAVSQQQDADVLMSALRKHGYTVGAHREPLDGLIHVRIGPFKTRVEAERMRLKLLNDGYNALVQP